MIDDKLSVIIPVYNTKKYLRQCLDSVIGQTFKNLEIICVNDGSTDEILAILEKYAHVDPRIRIIDKKNEGRSSARNAGIKMSTGKYITFIDSDDTLDKKAYEIALPYMTDDIDFVCFGIQTVGEQTSASKKSDDKYYSIKYRGKTKLTPDVILNTDASCCNKIFSKSLISQYDDIEFPIGLNYEDACFYFKYTAISQWAYFLPEKLHYYLRHENSIMAETFRKTPKAIDHLLITKNIFDFYQKHQLFDSQKEVFEKVFESFAEFSFRHTTNVEDVAQTGKKLIKIMGLRKHYPRNQFIKKLSMQNIKPAFSEKNIPVVFATDRNYHQYFSVVLQSILDTSHDCFNYDLIVLQSGVSQIEEALAHAIIKDKSNFSLRYIENSHIIDVADSFFVDRHLTAPAYFRLFLPELLQQYDKILYLDIDLIVTSDIAELYQKDMGNNLLGGAVDYVISREPLDVIRTAAKALKDLGLTDTSGYVNSGVLLFNLSEMRLHQTQKKLIDLVQNNRLMFHDQDALNVVCAQKIMYFSPLWNFLIHEIPGVYDEREDEENINIVRTKSYKIIHYRDIHKPWNSTENPLYPIWWETAKKTPFYMNMLSEFTRTSLWSEFSSSPSFKIWSEFSSSPSFKIWSEFARKQVAKKIIYYRFMEKITWGKRRRNYTAKKQNMRRDYFKLS